MSELAPAKPFVVVDGNSVLVQQRTVVPIDEARVSLDSVRFNPGLFSLVNRYIHSQTAKAKTPEGKIDLSKIDPDIVALAVTFHKLILATGKNETTADSETPFDLDALATGRF